jgi:hypothetical protein
VSEHGRKEGERERKSEGEKLYTCEPVHTARSSWRRDGCLPYKSQHVFSESLQRSKNINEKGGEKGCKLRSVPAAKDLPGNRQGQRAMVPCKSGQRGGKARTSSVGLEVPGQKQYVEMLMSGASRLVNVNEAKPSYELPVRGILRLD